MNQAPVTGESWPIEKAPGDAVFAGTINGTGALEVDGDAAARPTARSRASFISSEHAQQQRAPMQTFVDRFARRYTPAVVVLAIARRVRAAARDGLARRLVGRVRRLELSRARAARRRVSRARS